MARSTAGLTEQDLAELRRLLAEGKRPRVQLSGPHFPVGAAGTVVRVGTPEADGADFVRVRVKVNGMTDELAFAPGELSLRRPGSRAAKATGRAVKARPAKASGRATKSTSRTAEAAGRPTKASGRPAKAADQTALAAGLAAPPAVRPDSAAQPASASQAASAGHAASAAVGENPAAVTTGSGPAPERVKPARSTPAKSAAARRGPATSTAARPEPVATARAQPASGRRRKPAAVKVSFTISSSGANWTLSATRGNKSLVRTTALPPGVVTAVSELLDQPALSDSVSEINDVALAEAQARAEQLRAELDQLEAVLATHRRP
jgi:hypothetical protein